MPERRIGVIDRALLPSGVVSFLLTDIVGSTLQWDREPVAMAAALDRHDEIIEEAVTAAGGLLLKFRGEGDATFSVFHRAGDAVDAAVDAHHRLSVEPWLPHCRIAVRMAIHSGEAIERGGDYFGGTVNRAARLRGLAGAREILVTEATRDLVGDRLPDGAHIVELGVRVLRDLSRPERIFAIAGPGGVLPVWDDPAPVASGPPVVLDVAIPRQLRDRSPFGFVGRTDECGVLAAAIDRATTGDAGLVLVSGEPGAGKTELVAQVVGTAVADWPVVALYGRCDEDVGSPYQPWVDAIGRAVGALPDGALDADLRRLAGDLGRIVPEIAARWPAPSSVTGRSPDADRYLLFRSLTELLDLLSGISPLVIVLDDLHWSDDDSLALLRHICAAGISRVAIIATYRPFEASQHPSFTDLLAATRRLPNVERIELGGLPEPDLATLAERVAGPDAGAEAAEFAHLLLTETRGNPFFVNEILRTVREEGVAADLPDAARLAAWTGTAAGVGDVVFQRVARLGPEVETALTMAAVIGQEGDLDVLAASLNRPAADVFGWFEAAVAAGLMVDQSAGRFVFTHALVGHSLYQRLGPTPRARAHEQVASAIEAVRAPDLEPVEADLAFHWGQSAGAASARRALGYMRTVGRRSVAKSAPGDAVRWFRQAVAAADVAGVDDATRCELVVELGEAERMAGDGAFRHTLLDAAATARRIDQPRLLVRAALANNRGYQSGSDTVDGERVEALEAAIAVVPADAPGDRARLLGVLANELAYSGDYERRAALSDESLALARSVGDPTILAQVLQQRHLAVQSPEMVPHLQAIAEEACELADTVGDPALRFFAYLISYCSVLYTLDMTAARERRREFMSLADRLQQPLVQWTAAWHSVALLVLEGDLDAAEAACERGLRLGLSCGQQDARSIYFAGLLGIRWQQGRLAEHEGLLGKVVESVPADVYTAMAVSNRCLWALSLGEADRLDDAEIAFEPLVRAGFGRVPMDPIWLLAMSLAAETATLVRSIDAATQLLPLLDRAAGQTATIGSAGYGLVDRLRGQLHAVRGETAVARELFGEAATLAEREGAVIELARAERALAALG